MVCRNTDRKHMKRSPAMKKNSFICTICICVVFAITAMPSCVHAIDTTAEGIAVLDSHTFVVTKEFAGEIRLYVCSVKEGKIFIRDSASIPYMTMDHRDLNTLSGKETGAERKDPAIIRTVP